MHVAMIPGANKVLSPPDGWDAAKNGPCLSLPVAEIALPSGQTVMLSAWLPTAEELKLLQEGAPVYLQVTGASHPPVNLFVPAITKIDIPGTPPKTEATP